MKKIVPPMVEVRPNDSLEKVLKKFKKVVKKSGILYDFKNHQRYEKPSDIKRRKKGLSILRNKHKV